jgi:hypothetical protein
MDTDFKGSMFSGEIFNEVFVGYHFIIPCSVDDKIDHTNVIKEGLNEKAFTSHTATYAYGGYSFTDQINWLIFRTYGITVTHYRDVEIPSDSQIFIDKEEYRSNKLIFGAKKAIEDMEIWTDKDFCRVAIKTDVKWIRYAKALDTTDYFNLISFNPNLIQHLDMTKVTPSMALTAVCHDGLLLKHITDQNLQMCRLAVDKNYRAFPFAKFQDEEICLKVVKEDGMMLEHVISQTLNVCIEAIKQNENAIKFVRFQTLELCELAFKKNPRVFPHLKVQTERMAKEAVSFMGLFLEFVLDQTEEICEIAVSKNHYAIKFALHQTPEMALDAVSKEGTLLQYVIEKTPDVCNAALYNTLKAFEYIDDPAPETQLYAIKKNGMLIKHVKNPTEAMKLSAVDNKWKSIEFIEEQSLELCELAFSKSKGKAFKFCKLKSGKMIKDAVSSDGLMLEYVDPDKRTMEICEIAFKKNRRAIKFIPAKFQTESMMIDAMNDSTSLLEFLHNPTEEVYLAALRKNPASFSSIKNPTEDMCIIIVSKCGLNIKDVPADLQTPTVCLIAITDTPHALEHIKNQTEDLCVQAVSENANVLKFCKIRTPPVLKAAVKKDGYVIKDLRPDEITLELADLAVNSWGYCLQHVPKHIQTRELCMKAVKKSGVSLEYVRDDLQDEEICLEAVTQSPYSFKYVKVQTPAVCMYAITHGYNVFEFVKNPTPEMRLAALKKDSSNIRHIQNPTREELKLVLKASKYSLNQISEDKRTVELCLNAIHCEEESYTYSTKYKDDNLFNLMAYLVNPNINGKLNDAACEFINNHPYVKMLADNVSDQPVLKPAPAITTPQYNYYECGGIWD